MSDYMSAAEVAEFCDPEWYDSDRELFTQADVQALVGQTVRDLVDFSGVPRGMTATVIQADEEPPI